MDIAAPPRKSLLRLLAEHCAGEEARQTLLRWTSRAGRDEYAKVTPRGRDAGWMERPARHPHARAPPS